MADFDGRVALVTGGTKGIGLAISQELAGLGAKVYLNHRRDSEQAKEALRTVRDLQPDAQLLAGDIRDPHDVQSMFRTLRSETGRLDLFVNNAGITSDGHALMMGEQKWNDVLDTNLTGAFLCCRAAGRMMVRQSSGAMVIVSSTSGVAAPAGQANYAASKAGLLSLARVLAKEFGADGVRVNAVIPGFVDTGMTRVMPQEQLQAQLSHVPLGHVGTPGHVASAVGFLLSDQAAYITGSSITVDGGLTA